MHYLILYASILLLISIYILYFIRRFRNNNENMKQVSISSMIFDNDEYNISSYMGNTIVPKIEITRGTYNNRGFNTSILK